MIKNFTNNSKKVVVAMSGGVDSSVAAALLKEQGHDVIGVTMGLSCSSKSSDRGCCSFSAAADAKKVADSLGFPHYTLNFKDEFRHYVIDNFIEEYKNGRTPNPCIRCNQFIKFDLLMKKAKELGADYVATGHYARRRREILNPKSEILNNHQNSNYKLLKGKDSKKDQSYVLYTMNQEALAHTLFPLGDLTKQEVRKIARELELPVAEKEESQEICFVEEDDYGRFIREAIPKTVKPGDIVDKAGKVVGRHEGIAFYTIGQRKGVGAHQGNPKYVVAIDRGNNQIVIGDQEDLLAKELLAEQVSFISEKLPTGHLEVAAKIRYNAAEAKAVVYLEHGAKNTEHRARVVFEKPQKAITPGQSAVFYKGDEVVGGGIIN